MFIIISGEPDIQVVSKRKVNPSPEAAALLKGNMLLIAVVKQLNAGLWLDYKLGFLCT